MNKELEDALLVVADAAVDPLTDLNSLIMSLLAIADMARCTLENISLLKVAEYHITPETKIREELQ